MCAKQSLLVVLPHVQQQWSCLCTERGLEEHGGTQGLVWPLGLGCKQKWWGELDPLTLLPRQQGLWEASGSIYRDVIHRYEINSSHQLPCCDSQGWESSPKPELFSKTCVQPQKQHHHLPGCLCQLLKNRSSERSRGVWIQSDTWCR